MAQGDRTVMTESMVTAEGRFVAWRDKESFAKVAAYVQQYVAYLYVSKEE